MPRINLSGTADALLAGIALKRGPKEPENVALSGGKLPEEVSTLRRAFRGKLDGPNVLSSRPDDVLIARNGKASLFSLASFRGAVTRPQAQGPGQGPAIGGQPAAAPAAAPQHLAPLDLPPPPDEPPPPLPPPADLPPRAPHLRLRDAQEAVADNTALVNRWLGEDPLRNAGERGRTPAAIEERGRALEEVRKNLAELDTLAPSGEPEAAAIAAARRDCMCQATRLLMPGLSPQAATRPPLPSANEHDALVEASVNMGESLERLDGILRKAASGGQAAYDVTKLIGLLAAHGRIGELAASPLPAHRLAAMEGLVAVADTIAEAVAPPRDGAALNSILGVNAELDGVLKLARRQATEDLMLQGLAREQGVPVGDLSNADRRQARADATEVVDKDAALATMKVQVLRGLEAAGGGRGLAITGLGGLRVDSGLVAGLRDKLGADAKQVGVIVAGLVLAEREALASDGSRRLLADVRGELAALRTEHDDAGGQLGGLGGVENPAALQARQRALAAEIRHLEGREASLMPEAELVRRRVQEAQANLDTVSGLRDAAWQRSVEPEASDEAVAEARQAFEHHKQQAILAENNLAGWQARLDGLAAQPLPGQHARAADYAAAAAIGGLTAAELKAMGLTDAESAEALGVVKRLAQQGLSSAEQVKQATREVNAVMSAFRDKSSRIQDGVQNQLGTIASGRDEDRAKLVADLLMRRVSGDPAAGATALGELGPAGDAAAAKLRAALAADLGLAQVLAEMARVPNEYGASAQRYGDAEQSLLRMSDRLRRLDDSQRAAREAIAAFDPARDPVKAEGLTTSKNLLRAVTILGKQQAGAASAEEQAELAGLRRKLAGFDRNALSVPMVQVGRQPLSEAALAQLANDQALMGAARAIVFLREAEPPARRELHGEIADKVSAMDALCAERREAMGIAAPTLRDTIRLAILAAHAEAGGPADFHPGEHAGAVRDMLQACGLPVEHLAPEINLALSQAVSPQALANWAQLEDPGKGGEGLRGAAGEGPFPQHTRSVLLDSVDRMAFGTRVRVTTGGQVTAQSGTLPLTPLVGLNAKAAIGTLHGLEIARGPEGYELAVRNGWDGKLGAEVSSGMMANPLLNLSVAANLEGSGMRASGVSIRFPNTAQGLHDLKALLDRMLTQQEFSARDIAAADQVVPIVEQRLGGKASIEGRLKVGIEQATSIGKVGVSGGAKAGVSVAATQLDATVANTNQVQIKRDREIVLEAYAGVRAQYGLKPGTSNDAIASDALALNAATGVSCKSRSKEVYGADGLAAAGTEQARQVHLPVGPAKWAIVESMGGARFQRGLDALPQEKRDAIRQMVDRAGADDMVNIGFGLTAAARGAANERLVEAKALRTGRAASPATAEALDRATKLEAQAQAILDDDDNYAFTKFQLVATKETLDEVTAANLLAVQYRSFVEDKGEWVAAQVTA